MPTPLAKFKALTLSIRYITPHTVNTILRYTTNALISKKADRAETLNDFVIFAHSLINSESNVCQSLSDSLLQDTENAIVKFYNEKKMLLNVQLICGAAGGVITAASSFNPYGLFGSYVLVGVVFLSANNNAHKVRISLDALSICAELRKLSSAGMGSKGDKLEGTVPQPVDNR